jgi:hypothetical protein
MIQSVSKPVEPVGPSDVQLKSDITPSSTVTTSPRREPAISPCQTRIHSGYFKTLAGKGAGPNIYSRPGIFRSLFFLSSNWRELIPPFQIAASPFPARALCRKRF